MADGTSERYVQLGLAVVLIAVLHGMLGLLVQGLLLQLGVLVPVAAGEAVLLLLLLVLVVEVGTSEAFSRGKGLEVCWGAGKGLTLLGGGGRDVISILHHRTEQRVSGGGQKSLVLVLLRSNLTNALKFEPRTRWR